MIVAGASASQGATGPLGLAQQLVNVTGSPAGVFNFVPLGACTAIQALLTRTPLDIAITSLSADGAPTSCIGVSAPPDIVISDVFADTCATTIGVPTPDMLSAGRLALGDFWGPVQVTTFAVTRPSTELAISADAAYVVFGFGGAGSMVVTPWSDPNSILAPNRQSALLELASVAIGLPVARWTTATHSTVTALPAAVSALEGATNPSAAIALLPSQAVESNADSLRALAYQHSGQSCGYTPSSDANHFDKINVREGRYALWGPLHVYMALDVAGNVVDHGGAPNALLTQLANLLTATGPIRVASVDAGAAGGADSGADSSIGDDTDAAAQMDEEQLFVEGSAQAGLIPWCAMNVLRLTEMGAESSYQPPEPCGCYYENLVGAPTALCMACRTDLDCNSSQPTCRFGFCEVQ